MYVTYQLVKLHYAVTFEHIVTIEMLQYSVID